MWRIDLGEGCEVHGVNLFPQGVTEMMGHLLQEKANGAREACPLVEAVVSG